MKGSLHVFVSVWVFLEKYRDAGVVLIQTQAQVAMQVDVCIFPSEPEHSEGEVVGCWLSVALNDHGLVSRARTAAQKEKNTQH